LPAPGPSQAIASPSSANARGIPSTDVGCWHQGLAEILAYVLAEILAYVYDARSIARSEYSDTPATRSGLLLQIGIHWGIRARPEELEGGIAPEDGLVSDLGPSFKGDDDA
jgi:hypothetical protein